MIILPHSNLIALILVKKKSHMYLTF